MRVTRAVVVGLISLALVGLAAWVFKTAAPAEHPAASNPAEPPPPKVVPVPEPVRQPVPVPVAASGLDMPGLHNCHTALLGKLGTDRVDCDHIPADETARLSHCLSVQPKVEQWIQEAVANAASCPDELVNASAYYEAVKSLALRGDIPAQRCFIQGYFGPASGEGEESRLSLDQVNEYLELARKFIDAAFERGDWSVVRWLGRATLYLPDGMLRSAYPFGIDKLETTYRMKYLLLLGDQTDFEKDEPRRLTDLVKKNRSLSAEQIQEAEAWAREMYDQHFNGSQEGASLTYNFCEH
jgi:hypothetical protein